MGRTRKKGNKIVGRFVALEHHVLDAFKDRKVSASAILTYILLKKNFNPTINGKTVILTYSEAENWFSSKTFARALRELQEKGFIKKVYCGGLCLGRSLERAASIYEFSSEYRRSSTP